MASYLPSSSFLVSFVVVFLFIVPSFVRPIVKAAEASLVTDVCTKTKNSTFCEAALSSDPRASTADLKTLCQVSIDLAHSNATGTRTQIGALMNQTTDPKLKLHFQDCADFYDTAIDNLAQATDYLKSGDYMGVNLAGSSGIDAGDDCEDAFKEEPSFPSPLTKNNENLEILGAVVAIIANLLASG